VPRACAAIAVFVPLVLLAGCGRRAAVELGPGPLGPALDGVVASKEAREPEPERLAPEPPSLGPYRIRTGDVLTISVLGEPDMTQTVPVGPDGRISYYAAHDMVAAGKTFEELRRGLRESLLPFFKDPEVSVVGKEFTGNTVTILGQVTRPGQYVVRSDTRLLDVVAMAGGIARTAYWSGPFQSTVELADLASSFLLRGDRFVDVDFKALFAGTSPAVARNNVHVRAGDSIYIPSAATLDNRVFVLGEVANPRVVRYQRDMSFLEAVAEAGGVTAGAWERRAFVVRGSLTSPEIVPINLRAAATGAVPNVALRSGDIVYVPKSVLGKTEEIARQLLPLLQGVNSAEDVGR
jgi:polysaccharide export outer membrane protein